MPIVNGVLSEEKMAKYIKKRGFTDKLYIANLAFAWGYTLLCVILTCLGGLIGIEDYSFVSIVTPLIWGELTVHSAFVIWKAKMENVEKFKMKDNTSISID